MMGDSRFASRKIWESVATKSGEGVAVEEAEEAVEVRGEQESRVGGSIRGSRRCDFIKTMYPEGAFEAHLDTQSIVINCADRNAFCKRDERLRERVGQTCGRVRGAAEVFHRLNGLFAGHMRDNAQKRKLVDSPVPNDTDQPEFTPRSDLDSELDDGQILVNKVDFDTWVKEVRLLSLNLNCAYLIRSTFGQEAESSPGTTIMFSFLSSSMSSPVDGAKSHLIMSSVSLTRLRSLLKRCCSM